MQSQRACQRAARRPQVEVASGGEMAGPWLIEVAGLYIVALLECPSAALQFQAALGLLRLAALARRVAHAGGTTTIPPDPDFDLHPPQANRVASTVSEVSMGACSRTPAQDIV